MASFSTSVKVFSRTKGHSAVEAAAYRSGEKLIDRETDHIADYTRKNGVIYTNITCPDGVKPPEWAESREDLWNKVHEVDSRKNASLAREIMIAIPHEITQEQQQLLVDEYAQWISNRHQIIVDAVIHEPHHDSDDRNYHAHIMMTTRQITDDGFKKQKTKTIDGQTIRFIPLDYGGERGREEINIMREKSAELSNKYLEEAGSDERVDHRSYKDRGIDKEPTIHMGKSATNMERKGLETDRGNQNREINHRNRVIESVKATGSWMKQTTIELYQSLKARMVERIQDTPEERERTRLAREQEQGRGYSR